MMKSETKCNMWVATVKWMEENKEKISKASKKKTRIGFMQELINTVFS